MAVAQGGGRTEAEVRLDFISEVEVVHDLQALSERVGDVEYDAGAVVDVAGAVGVVEVVNSAEIEAEIPGSDLVLVNERGTETALNEGRVDVVGVLLLVVEFVVTDADASAVLHGLRVLEVVAAANRGQSLGRCCGSSREQDRCDG